MHAVFFANQSRGRDALKLAMLTDRKAVFVDQMGWDHMTVTDQGEEKDEYDALSPIYCAITDPAEQAHFASARMLPMTGRVMVRDHFPGLYDDSMATDPLKAIEITRFCVPSGKRGYADMLFAECRAWLYRSEYTSFIGVYDLLMQRVYRRSGWPPRELNHIGSGRDRLFVGQWHKDDDKGRADT